MRMGMDAVHPEIARAEAQLHALGSAGTSAKTRDQVANRDNQRLCLLAPGPL